MLEGPYMAPCHIVVSRVTHRQAVISHRIKIHKVVFVELGRTESQVVSQKRQVTKMAVRRRYFI